MLVNVKKILFIGPQVDKELFFSKAQIAGIIEFINPEKEKKLHVNQKVEDFAKAIKILRGFTIPIQKKQIDLVLAQTITTEIITAKHAIEHAENDIHKVTQTIALIQPFGNVSMDDLAQIEKETKRKFYFYCAKSSKHFSEVNDDLIMIEHQDGLDYFIALTQDPLHHRDLTEVHITDSLSLLKKRKVDLQHIISENESAIKKLTCYSWLLHYALTEALNKTSFNFASDLASHELDNNLFVIEGWVPENKKADVLKLARQLNIFSEEVAIEKDQTAPTYLENKGMPKIGEDVIHIFDTPSTHDKDPSVWVLVAFSLFFAMIVGDAGYGLIFLIAALFMRFKIKNLKGLTSRMIKLVTILAVSCIIWGAAMNSFFAISFSPTNILRSNSLITWLINKKADFHLQAHDDVYSDWVKKYPEIANAHNGQEFVEAAQMKDGSNSIVDKFTSNITLEIALFIGSVHIILGMLRYIKKIPTGIGWVLFIIGCYLYFPYYLDSTSLIHFVFNVPKISGVTIGLNLIYGGITLSVLIALIKHGFTGIFECMAAIQIFADIMSYLRIYALGFAGAIVATQINEMAAHMPLALAIVAVTLAHIGNIILSVMGGVIHGLRLNFLEWYRYSFEGGGKKFNPLELHIFE